MAQTKCDHCGQIHTNEGLRILCDIVGALECYAPTKAHYVGSGKNVLVTADQAKQDKASAINLLERLEERIEQGIANSKLPRQRAWDKKPKPRPLKSYTPRIMALGSPLAQLQTLLDLRVCAVCSIWGGDQHKARGRVLCQGHTPKPPWAFKCLGCGRQQETEFKCCEGVEPLFGRKPAHLRGSAEAKPGWVWNPEYEKFYPPTIQMNLYARSVGAGASVKGLDVLRQLAEGLGLDEQLVLDRGQELAKTEVVWSQASFLGTRPNAQNLAPDVEGLLAEFGF